jgi:hypothetical protein
MKDSLNLLPEHQGKFEVFSTKYGKRYARYSDGIGTTWYSYDFFTESYRSLSNETMIGSEGLIEALEDAYRKTPILPTLETAENGNQD